VLGGAASIEHGSFLDDEAIRLMAEHKTVLVPTLYLPTHYLSNRDRFAFDSSAWDLFERLRAKNLDNLRKARRAGVRVVSGSDAVAGLHGSNAKEPEWLEKGGMTPAEVLRAATVDAAALLGLSDRIGAVEPGKAADLVAVRGNPLAGVAALERVVFVMKAGRVVRSESSGPNGSKP
jgi:imidazolonepropionase-like amidohydrolase